MTETTDAGRTARTGTEESREDKGTANRILEGALGGALLGLIESITDDQQAREQGYHADLDHGQVEVTYVPEVGEERPAMALPVESADGLYRSLTADDGESETHRIESTASGEVLAIHDKEIPLDVAVGQILADDRDSLQHALASVLEDRGAVDLLEGVKGVLCETNDFEILDAERVKVSYKGEAGFAPNELAALRDSKFWISGISPDYIVVEKECDAE